MDYKKKYIEALERAKAYHRNELAGSRREMTEYIFPELRESEDERMMREFNDWLCEEIECRTNDLRDEKDRRTLNMLCYVLTKFKDWLEKQKENPKYVDSIPADCVSSAKCEDMSLKHSDSLGTDIRDTPAYWRGWDDAMKQKEQKPNIELVQRSWYMEGYNDRDFFMEPKWILKTGEGGPKYEPNPKYGKSLILGPEPCCCSVNVESEYDKGWRDGHKAGLKDAEMQKPAEIHNPTDEEVESWRNELTEFKNFATKQAKENQLHISYTRDVMWENFCSELLSFVNSRKPAWSEEDEMYLSQAIETLEHENYSILADKLKSIRPYPSWKPSEEQMEALNAMNCCGELSYQGQQQLLIDLYQQLKKLM